MSTTRIKQSLALKGSYIDFQGKNSSNSQNSISNYIKVATSKNLNDYVCVNMQTQSVDNTKLHTICDINEPQNESANVQSDPNQFQFDEMNVIKKLGEGNFGTVYLYSWKGMNIAVKSIQLNHNVNKCVNEKEIMHELTDANTPNVINLIGYAVKIPYYYIAMEYAPNGSLEDYIAKNTPFAPDKCYQLSKEIAYAIRFLHDKGIIHCDIKSANILLDANMHAKLADFGLANKKDKITAVHGTPLWCAPEIFLGILNSEKTDIFSLGVLYWEIAAWRKTDDFGLNYQQYVIRILDVNNPIRQTLPQDCPPGFKKLIERCWAQRADHRPSADEVTQELESNEDILMRP